MKRVPLKRSAALVSGGPLRRTPLRRVSAKNAAKERQLAEAKKHVRWRANGMCEGNVVGVCPDGRHRGVHVHHVRPRSRGVDHSPDNLRLLCSEAHGWAHAHPAEARARGLLA